MPTHNQADATLYRARSSIHVTEFSTAVTIAIMPRILTPTILGSITPNMLEGVRNIMSTAPTTKKVAAAETATATRSFSVLVWMGAATFVPNVPRGLS